MYDSTLLPHEDFTTTLSLKPPEIVYPPSRYDWDIDECYPFTHEMAPSVTGTAANYFVSHAITEVDHDRFAGTADDVSGTQFSAKETEAQMELVKTVLSALAPSLQKFGDDCIAASTKAAQDAISAQRPGVPSWVSAADDYNSAASYVSLPPPVVDDFQTSGSNTDGEAIISHTPSYTSPVSPPASQLSSTQLRNARMARRRAKKQLRHEKKTAAWRAMAQPPTDFRATADSETRHAAWNTDREARRLEKLTRDAARFLNREKHEQDWKAKNDTLSDAPLHLVTNRVTKNGQVERDTVESF
jgi:hypothetical protein